MIDPVSASGVVIAALALAHRVLKSPSVPKSDKKKIAKEAERLVQIAQMSDIDKEVRKAKAAEGRRNAKYWTSPKELPGLVAISMSSLMKIKPRTGWVRADRIPDESAAQEILKLRNEIALLQKSLGDLKDSPPEGSIGLAQGDETIDLRFRVEGDFVQPYSFSWNTLVEVLGPVLMNSPTEDELKSRIVAAWDNRYHAKESYSNILDEDFQKVKVQFKALGLITQIGPARWLLTPQGDSVLMRLAAIKSKSPLPTE